MAKIRHSKPRKEPLTIELGPDEVSRIEPPNSITPDDNEAATAVPGEAPASEAATEPVAEQPAVASSSDAGTPAENEVAPAAEAASEDMNAATSQPAREVPEGSEGLIGSEWPPAPPPAEEAVREELAEEERVKHAFGRDPDTPPPGSTIHDDATTRMPPPAPPPRAGRGSMFAAGVAGGLIALLGAAGLQWAGVLGSPGTTVSAPADTGAVDALKAEIAALKQDVDAVKAGSGGGDTAALSQSVTDLQGGLKGLTASLDQVKGDVAALKDAIAQGAAGDGAAVQTLGKKLAALESAVAALGNAGSGVPQEALDAINQKLGAVEQAAAAAAEAIKASDGRVATLEQNAAAASEAAKAGESRMAALEASVAALSKQIESQAGQPKVALAIAAAALKSAIERGGTFTAEVETFAAIAPNAPELAALREIAAKGIASRTELVEEMDGAANAMIAAAEPVDENAGFWDRLLSSAESLVTVRPIGAVEGDSAPAKVARMEVAVKAGDFAKALAEYDTLPEPAKAAGQAYADKIRARATAEDLVAKALAGALKSA